MTSHDQTIAVAYDGSTLSSKALDFVSGLMHHGAMAARQAKVLHIRANPDKEEKVPADLKSDALREKVSAFADEQSIQLEWYEEKRGTNKTSEALCKLVLHSDCDFIAIGSQGRKDNADPTHLGSTGAAPCKMMNGGCFVVKSGSKIPDGEPLTFVVCCDDSPYAQKAVFDAKRFCRPGIDKIAVLYCSAGTVAMQSAVAVGGSQKRLPFLNLDEAEEASTKLQLRLLETFKESKAKQYADVSDEFIFHFKQKDEKADEIILAEAEKAGADILVLAHKGLTYTYGLEHRALKLEAAKKTLERESLGSVATNLIRNAKCTVLLTKGKYAV